MLWRAGEKVGQYEIISELGRGGMATVYKAYHAQLDRHVAIKVMHQTYADEASFIERFKRESTIVASLEHPNIVPVYDYNEHDSMPYLVMKFVQGRSLKEQLFKNPPDLNEIIRIMTAIAQATAYAHDKGVLHRDIKPSNIIIDHESTPYLADFGLARIAAAGESTMSADVLLGTPNYMSPEQARGAKDIDHRSDLYSLGIVLYELIVGQVPFSATTPLAVIQDHIHTPLPRPSQINPDVPPKLESVLRKALKKSPDQRYNSATEMMDDFKRAIEQDNLESLPKNRAQIADESLARWRSAYIQHTSGQTVKDISDEEDDSIANSIRNLAMQSSAISSDDQPTTIHQPEPIAKPIQTEKLKTPSIIRHEPNARIWVMSGIGLIIFSLFLIVAVILNASNTFVEIASIVDNMDKNASIMIDDPNRQFYDVPNLRLAQALTAIDEDSENPINYLALATAHYRENDIDSARIALNTGESFADNSIPYLATATSIADTAEDKLGAITFGILLWDITATRDSEDNQLANNDISEYLYQQSLHLADIQLSRANTSGIVSFLGEVKAQAILRSPITRILVTSNNINRDRQRLAETALGTWTEATYELPIAQLTYARYNIFTQNTTEATQLLNQLVEASTTPVWIVTIAQDLLIELEE